MNHRSLAMLGVLVSAGCARPPAPPLETSLWYWHGPVALDEGQDRALDTMRVETLFIRAATLSQEEGHLSVVLPQRFESGSRKVHLVFRLDASIAAEFDRLDLDAIAKKIVEAHARVGGQAETEGWQVIGIQLDFDCPTRLLERYADLVRRVRGQAPRETWLTVTGLGSWYESPSIEALADACDEVVPQCYEAELGTSLDQVHPVSNLPLLERTIERAERLGRPYRIGLPAYGHALLYDAGGRLASTFRRLGPRAIARHQSFVLESAYPMDSEGRRAERQGDWIGEDLLVYRATQPARDGKGLGFRVAFKIPTPRVVQLALARIRNLRPRHCRGVVLFRVAEPDEEMVVPLASLAAISSGAQPSPDPELTARHEMLPYPGIERADASEPLPVVFTVRVENRGDGPTAIRPDAIVLQLEFDAPGNALAGGDFVLDSTSGISGGSSSLARATRLRLRSPGLLPGETAVAKLRLEGGAKRVKVVTRTLLPGGFDTVERELIVQDLREESQPEP